MKMKALVYGVVSFVFISTYAFSDQLLIQDFDTGEKASENAYDFGAWNKDPGDSSQGCVEAMESVDKFGDKGMSLRLDYDVDSPAPAYNGFWVKVKELDLSQYKYLNFYIKGNKEKGFTKVVKLEIKNPNEVGKYLFSGVSEEWTLAKIPLSDFRGLRDWTGITELVMVFDDINTRPKSGTVYLDNIFLSTE